jgi:hypothetical protein
VFGWRELAQEAGSADQSHFHVLFAYRGRYPVTFRPLSAGRSERRKYDAPVAVAHAMIHR